MTDAVKHGAEAVKDKVSGNIGHLYVNLNIV
jgi:hypothetical protein